jgi:hypothetical protein
MLGMKEVEDEIIMNEPDPKTVGYFDKYLVAGDTFKKMFYGKYTFDDLAKNNGSISVERQGGFTTAILSMLLEKEDGKPKYTIDQLLDPKQFLKEKQEKFDEVVKHSRASNESKDKTMAESPDGKWIVETLYNGMKLLNDMIDEAAEKIDVTKDDFMYSEEFAKVTGLSAVCFDAWQEINRFDVMRHEVVQADRPELTTEGSRRVFIDNLVNPLSDTFQSINKLFGNHNMIKYGKSDNVSLSSYINNAFHVKYVTEVMRDWKASGKKLSQYMIENEMSVKFSRVKGAADEKLFDFNMAFATSVTLPEVVDKRIWDGSLLKNVEYDAKKGELKNFPKLKDDESDFEVEAPEKTVNKAAEKTDEKMTAEKSASKKTTEKQTVDEKNIKKASGKNVEKKIGEKKTADKSAAKKTAPKKIAPKKAAPTIATAHGENIPVGEVLDYLQALKQTAGEARGLFHDSDEYINFYMAIDDVADAARHLKSSRNNNIINADADKLKEYREAVNRLKDCAKAYEDYKMSDHTKDPAKEPDKKKLNSDDKRKLKIINSVLRKNRYFNLEQPQPVLTNDEFLKKTDEALIRLKEGKYRTKKKFIEDSGYAVFGQMYRFTNRNANNIIPEEEPVNLQQVMQEKIASGEFEKTLISKNDPKKYISSQKVAEMAENEMKMKEVARSVNNLDNEVPKKDNSLIINKNTNKKESVSRGSSFSK